MQRVLRNALPASVPKPSGPPRVIGKRESASKREYHDRWSTALRAEQAASLAQFQAVLSNTNPADLRHRGLALFGLTAQNRGTLFGEDIYRFAAAEEGTFLPRNHRFVPGDVVLVSRSHPSKDLAFEGTLLDRAPGWVTVTTRDRPPADIARGHWRLDKGDDRATFEQCISAVRAATGIGFPAPKPDEQQPRPMGLSLELLPFFIGDAAKREDTALLAANPPSERLASLYRGKSPPPGFETWGLNDSQKRAVLAIPNRRLSLVRGPPGTGKTRTAITLIVHLVNMLKGSGITVLATAFTNIGTDNLLEGLLERGINALRVGSPTRVREELRVATVDAKIASHRLNATLERLRAEHALPEVINNVQTAIVREVVYGAQVICATCISSGFMDRLEFPVVIIDECTQASEPATLCPVVKGCQQLVLFGDDLQLGPTVISQDPATTSALGRSFFSRMVEQGGVEPFLLNTQYRMHPAISEWPSQHFYDSKLVDGIISADRPLPLGFRWPNNTPVAFVPIRKSREKDSHDGSKFNQAEASACSAIVSELVRCGMQPGNIGVISPYAAQVQLLSDTLQHECQLQVEQFRELSTPTDVTATTSTAIAIVPETLTVHTVDGFQGREKEVIIFSAVRSNPQGTVGFLSDWRRMNVALTRARRGLIVIGDPQTLSTDPHWNAWLDWAHSRQLFTNPLETAQHASKRSRK